MSCIAILKLGIGVVEHQSIGAAEAGVVLLVRGHGPGAVEYVTQLLYKIAHRHATLHSDGHVFTRYPVFLALRARVHYHQF